MRINGQDVNLRDEVEITYRGTVNDISNFALKLNDEQWFYHTPQDGDSVSVGVKVTKYADRPEGDLVGTVRADNLGRSWVKLGAWMPWCLMESGTRRHDDDVRGWPIIGASPGTPAAKAMGQYVPVDPFV